MERVYGPHAYCTECQINGLSTSSGIPFEAAEFSDKLGGDFRFRPQMVDRSQFHHSMGDCTRVLLDRFEIAHAMEPCLLFVDPKKPPRHLVVQLDPADPVKSLFSDALTPMSQAFRELSAYWQHRDKLRWRQRDFQEAPMIVSEETEHISKLMTSLQELQEKKAGLEKEDDSNRRELECLKGLLAAFNGDWRNADLRLSTLPGAERFNTQLRKFEELRTRYNDFSRKLSDVSVAADDPAAEEQRKQLNGTLKRVTNKRLARLGELRKDLSDKVYRIKSSLHNPDSSISSIRSSIETAQRRLKEAKDRVSSHDPSREALEQDELNKMAANFRDAGYSDEALGLDPSAFAVIETLQRTRIVGVQQQRKSLSNGEVRILFLAANPQTTLPLDLEEELRSIEIQLRAVQFRDKIVMTPAHAVRPDDVVRLLRQEKPSIVHFSGHGSPDGIVLRTDSGHLPVSGESLARLFRDRGVQLGL
jgi:predicted  nucleic acid-binding Zn-ribbon protein